MAISPACNRTLENFIPHIFNLFIMASPLWSAHKDLFFWISLGKWGRESGAYGLGKKLKDETQILALGKWFRMVFRKEGTVPLPWCSI